MAEARHRLSSATACKEIQITTALLWNTSTGEQLTIQESHILELHCDRMLAAAREFSWTAVLKEFDRERGCQSFSKYLSDQILTAIGQSASFSTAWKVRVLVSKDADVHIVPALIELHAVSGVPVWPQLPPKLPMAPPDQACRVFVDYVPTSASKSTRHKTSSREHYDAARARFNIERHAPTESEVILFNHDKEVMEASLCSPYFLRDGTWITPALSSGGNAGVSRRLALEAGLCKEQVLRVDELVEGETIWLSNAVRGFMPGNIHLFQR